MGIFPLRTKGNYVYRSLAPVAVSQVLNSLETLTNRSIYQDDSYLRGNLHLKLSRSRKDSILHKVVEMIDSPKTVSYCSFINIAGCVLILSGQDKKLLQALGSGLVLGNNKLLSIRNHYGRDGADQMGALILSYRFVTSFIKDDDKANDLFLKSVNAQTCLSYLVPGIAKAVSSKWLRGTALEEILSTQAYGSSPIAVRLKKYPTVMKYLTWGTILWESAFPLIYIFPEKFVPILLHAVKGFHFGVALTMGLPRFFWGFMGAHAAVEYII